MRIYLHVHSWVFQIMGVVEVRKPLKAESKEGGFISLVIVLLKWLWNISILLHEQGSSTMRSHYNILPPNTRLNNYGPGTFKTVSPNELFLILSGLPQVFCYSNENLTNTWVFRNFLYNLHKLALSRTIIKESTKPEIRLLYFQPCINPETFLGLTFLICEVGTHFLCYKDQIIGCQ